MPGDWLHLTTDEEVLWIAHPSIYTHIPGVLLGVGLVTISLWVSLSGTLSNLQVGPVNGTVAVLALVPLGVLALVPDHLRRVTTYYVVTDRRLIKKTGLIRRNVDPIRLDQIADFEYRQSFWERLLSIGDVRIMTAGTGRTDMVLENVPRVAGFTALLAEEIDAQYPHSPSDLGSRSAISPPHQR